MQRSATQTSPETEKDNKETPLHSPPKKPNVSAGLVSH